MTPITTLVALAALSGASDAVLLQFSSESCGPCRAMQPAVSRLISDGYPVQRIDVDRYPEVAKQYKIRGVPAFVLVAGNQEIGRVVGATSYDRLAGMFAQVQRPATSPAFPKGEGRGEGLATTPTNPHPAFGHLLPKGEGHMTASTAAPASPSNLQPTDFRNQATPDQAARAASVRLKVEDATGFGYGTGTIIDVHGEEALVVTCGHLFRESQGKGRISVDLFAPGATQPVEGQLVACDLDRDIALVSIRPGMQLSAAQVAPPGYAVRPGDPVFTIGCDKGADASVRGSQITAVNKYRGKPNFTAAGAPVDGRSGGGLFTADGQLIGICNAADPADNEGLYAGLASIHWQLDQIGQSEIYQRGARATQVAAAPTAAPTIQPASYTQPAEPQLLAVPTAPPKLPVQLPAASEMTSLPAAPAQAPATLPGTSADTELVVIIRSKRDPQQRSEIYVVDQATPDLLTNIVHAARRGAEERAAGLAAQSAGSSPARLAQRERDARQPVVRGQFGE